MVQLHIRRQRQPPPCDATRVPMLFVRLSSSLRCSKQNGYSLEEICQNEHRQCNADLLSVGNLIVVTINTILNTERGKWSTPSYCSCRYQTIAVAGAIAVVHIFRIFL